MTENIQVQYRANIKIDEKVFLPTVDVTINNIPFTLIVDIGGHGLVIDTDIAVRKGIFDIENAGEPKKAMGVGKEIIPIYFADIEEFTIAGRTLTNIKAGIMDFKNIKRGSKRVTADGIVGYQVLKNFCFIINYQEKYMELLDGNQEMEDVDFFDLEFISHHLIKIPVFIENIECDFILDTGASNIIINKCKADKLNLKYTKFEDKDRGIGGYIDTWKTEVTEFEVLGVKYLINPNLPMTINDLGNLGDGVVGYALLKHVKLIIDYPRGKIALI